MVTMHSDIVRNDWTTGEQRRVGRITVEYQDRPDLEQAICEKAGWDNAYTFATLPHTDDDCPFADPEFMDFND